MDTDSILHKYLYCTSNFFCIFLSTRQSGKGTGSIIFISSLPDTRDMHTCSYESTTQQDERAHLLHLRLFLHLCFNSFGNMTNHSSAPVQLMKSLSPSILLLITFEFLDSRASPSICIPRAWS